MPAFPNRIFHLAGQHYLTSWSLWLASAPLMIMGLVFTEINQQWTLESVGIVFAIGVLSHLALGAVWWLGNLTLLRPAIRQIVGWREVLTLCVLGGVVRSGVIAGLAAWWGVGELQLLNRIPTSVALVTFSFVMAAYSAELWRRYRDRRAELLYSLALGESIDSSRDLATSQLLSVDTFDIQGDIDAVRSRTKRAVQDLRRHLIHSPSDVDRVSELLESADRDWRSISHRLWEKSHPSLPHISVAELLRTLARSRPISLLVLAAGPVYGFFRILPILGPTRQVTVFLVWLLASWAIAWITNEVSARVHTIAVPAFFAGYTSLQVWGAVVGAFSLDQDLLRAQVSYVVFVSSTLALGLGLPQALERSGELVLEQLEDRVSARSLSRLRAQGEMFVLAQRIGMYLHSEVRGDFLRLALELKSALEGGERERADHILAAMERRVDEVGLDETARSPLDSLAEFLRNWSPIIQITSNLDDVEIPGSAHRAVEAVVTDAVNDAVRHGHATWISIYATRGRDGLDLTIHSDSVFTDVGQSPGLGSKTLTTFAPGGWSREVTDEGILRLSVKIPG